MMVKQGVLNYPTRSCKPHGVRDLTARVKVAGVGFHGRGGFQVYEVLLIFEPQ